MSNETEILAEAPPPDAALEFWKQRAKLTDQEVKALGEGAKKRAFYVSGLAQKDLVTTVSDGIEAALQNGETLADFKKRIAGVIKSQGWHSRRVEVIFRTNMQTAYAAGRYKKMQAVKRLRPYWQYVAVMDKRVRPNHAVLDGLVYPADHEFWNSNYPPNGFRCRCGVRTLSQRQVDKEGLTVQQNMPKDCVWTDKEGMQHFVHFPGADKGFKGNVGKDWLDGLLDLSIERLEKTPPKLAAAAVRTLVHGGFAGWAENPSGVFPLAVLTREDAARIGGKGQVAVMSAETLRKQQKHHPELTPKDYALAQDAVERGEKYPQGETKLTYVMEQPGGVVVIVKATRTGEELFVVSLWKLSREEAERDRTIAKLKKK